LVAEHDDLDVLGEIIHPVDAHELGDAADEAVNEAEGRDMAGSSSGWFLVKSWIGLLDPSRSLSTGWWGGRTLAFRRCPTTRDRRVKVEDVLSLAEERGLR